VVKQVKKRSDRKAIAADLVVGTNVRRLRTESGITLAEMAEALGISHQQLQKYETGANRVSAGMLYELARYFVMPVDALFAGTDESGDEDAALVQARRRCHSVIDRTSSLAALQAMAKVLRAMQSD
jgi:transcriptional regulator with XRE-family HTH domain